MVKKDQAKYIYEVVHGSATKASQLSLMVQGSNLWYKKLYAQLADAPITDPTSNVVIQRIIHSFYSPNHNTHTLSTGKDNEIRLQFISLSTLNNHKLIDCRALLAMAQESIKNRKNAVSFAKSFLQEGKLLPSGKTLDDLLKYVWVSMHQDQFPTATIIPSKWTFNGYVAFVLFACPIVTLPKERLGVV